jgi:hypothetical protein
MNFKEIVDGSSTMIERKDMYYWIWLNQDFDKRMKNHHAFECYQTNWPFLEFEDGSWNVGVCAELILTFGWDNKNLLIKGNNWIKVTTTKGEYLLMRETKLMNLILSVYFVPRLMRNLL